MNIDGKHLLVTGAGKRLGRAIAEKLTQKKTRLTVHYHHSQKEADNLVAWARAQGAEAQAISADLASVSALEKMAEAASHRFGPVEILVNSASVFYPTPLGEVTERQWDELQEVNLKGQFFLSQSIARQLKTANRPGVFLNLVDVNAQKTMPNYTPYVCSKAGLWMMTRNLARELAPLIRVNSISPGPVLLPENYTEEQRKKSEDRTLLKRLGTAGDIAAAALFLVENDYITGEDLAVDGGRSLA